MAKYIDKSILEEEIRRQIFAIDKCPKLTVTQIAVLEGNKVVLTKLLSFLDTLEVKGVDLDYIKKELDEVVRIYKPNGNFGWGTLYNVATHFFELGLKTQKRGMKITSPVK